MVTSGRRVGVAVDDPGGSTDRPAGWIRTDSDRFRITFSHRHLCSDFRRNLGDRSDGSSGPATQHVLAALLSGQRCIELVQCHLLTRLGHQRRPDHCHPRWPVNRGRYPAGQSLDVLDAAHRHSDADIVDHWIAPGRPGRRDQRPCDRLFQWKFHGPPKRWRRCTCGFERTGPFGLADADDRGGIGLLVGWTSLWSRLHHRRRLRRDPSVDRWWMPARHGRHIFPKRRSMAACRTRPATTARSCQRRRDRPGTDERGHLNHPLCDICQRRDPPGRRVGRKRGSVERFCILAIEPVTACAVHRTGQWRWHVRRALRIGGVGGGGRRSGSGYLLAIAANVARGNEHSGLWTGECRRRLDRQ